jgi:hypothetical protein
MSTFRFLDSFQPSAIALLLWSRDSRCDWSFLKCLKEFACDIEQARVLYLNLSQAVCFSDWLEVVCRCKKKLPFSVVKILVLSLIRKG